MTAKKFEILVLNQISQVGLKRFPAKSYSVAKDAAHPDAILVRSHDMHAMAIAPSVRAIARAGAGTNNIPVKAMSERGVPVFNAPGANANAVKELVLTGMLLAARNVAPALRFVAGLAPALPEMDKAAEEGKKALSVSEVLRSANFVTLHVPLVEATRHLVNADNIGLVKPGTVLLNFSRDGVVSESAVLAALSKQQLGWYVCDFPSAAINGHE